MQQQHESVHRPNMHSTTKLQRKNLPEHTPSILAGVCEFFRCGYSKQSQCTCTLPHDPIGVGFILARASLSTALRLSLCVTETRTLTSPKGITGRPVKFHTVLKLHIIIPIDTT